MGSDNGGNTWKGVTGETVKIAVPWHEVDPPTVELLERFFNTHFEFYGRSLDLVPIPGAFRTDSTNANAAKMIDEAREVDEDLKAFASTSYIDVQNYIYYDELARRQLLSANWNIAAIDANHFDAKHPYQWTYPPHLDAVQATWGDWICNQLVKPGGTADHAGPGLQGKPRKFGYLVHNYRDTAAPTTSTLDRILEQCGAKQVGEPLPRVERLYAEGFGAPTPTSMMEGQTAMKKLMDAGVSSVICICHATPLRKNEMPAATSVAFFPEWVTTSFALNAWDHFLGSGPPEQMGHMFGLSFYSKAVPTPDLPVTWAVKAVDPTFDWTTSSQLGRSSGGDWAAHFFATSIYPDLLLLASGIQMAGPVLDPESFAAGLQRTRFPNPANPYFAARVGFDGGRHFMVNDVALVWWGVDQQSTWGSTQGSGAWCYANRGARHSLGASWVVQKPAVFTGSCY